MASTDFLQSAIWRAFQEAVGHKTLHTEGEGFRGFGITYQLPVVGKYAYFPRGPVVDQPTESNQQKTIEALIELGKREEVKWIRIEPGTDEELTQYKKYFGGKLVKAPHDVQPREVLVMGITHSEDALLQKMKSKARYNIRLAEKKGVKVFTTREKKYEQVFLDLMRRTATRKEITPHPMSHYANFFSSLPRENLFLFVAEYEGEVLAANLLVLYGDTATYLHGGSSDRHRETMAPYLLQWRQICFAQEKGMKYYDFGGVKTDEKDTSWAGITRFKQGFAPDTQARLFPGSYDIVLDEQRYFLYQCLSRLRKVVSALKKSFKV